MADDNDGGLTDRIYEAAAVPELWPRILEELTRIAGAKGSVLIAVRGPDAEWISSSSEFDDFVREYFARFSGENERTLRLIAARHAGFLTDIDAFSEAERRVSPIYAGFLEPRGFGLGIATAIHVPSGETIVIHSEGSPKEGGLAPDAASRLDLLRPHLARATLLSARLGLGRARAAADALGAVGLPGALVDGGGRVIAANGPFDRMVPSVFQDRTARLTLADPAADVVLEEALKGLAQGARPGGVRSIALPARGGFARGVLHLVPVRRQARDIFTMAAGVAVVTPLAARAAPAAEVIRGLFDLTPAEARVAEAVVAGDTAAEIAARSGNSLSTVRNQIGAVLAKSGLRRQSELIALLAGIGLSPAGEEAEEGGGDTA